jgi:UPF0755 protein
MEKETKKRKNRPLLWISGVLLLLILSVGIYAYRIIFEPIKIDEGTFIFIDGNTTYDDVVNMLDTEVGIPNKKIFHLLAERMNYPNTVRNGRYAIKNGMTMLDIIRLLRSGNQEPIRLTFNNVRTRETLAGRLSEPLMIDSLSLLNALNDITVAENFGFNENTFLAMFIPNTYEVFWNVSIDNLLNRMKREYDAFWNENRRNRAAAIGLSPLEVSILAAIVEEECSLADEYSTVAGLYLNRLRRGMRLEADPTVKFALGDFELRRILFRHLEVESPYNTYRNAGLPPGPIRVPSIQVIEATLSPTQHNYIFMCAKDDFSGRHAFAVTHAEHSRNAARYHRALNERRIFQ